MIRIVCMSEHGKIHKKLDRLLQFNIVLFITSYSTLSEFEDVFIPRVVQRFRYIIANVVVINAATTVIWSKFDVIFVFFSMQSRKKEVYGSILNN